MSVAPAKAMALPGCRSAEPAFHVTVDTPLMARIQAWWWLSVCELAAGLYVDIKQRQWDVWRCRTRDTVAFAKDEPCGSVVTWQLWHVFGRKVKGCRGVMPFVTWQVDEDLQGVGPCIGTGRFIVNGAARSLEPIQITGRQIEVIAE